MSHDSFLFDSQGPKSPLSTVTVLGQCSDTEPSLFRHYLTSFSRSLQRRKGGTQAFKHQGFLFHAKFMAMASQQFEDALILVALKWK